MAGVQGFVQNILHGGIGTTELLNSYVRGDDTDDEEPEPQEKGKSSQRTAITVSAAPPILGSLLGSNAPKRDIYSPIRKDSSNENEVERQQMIAEHIKLTGGKKGRHKRLHLQLAPPKQFARSFASKHSISYTFSPRSPDYDMNKALTSARRG